MVYLCDCVQREEHLILSYLANQIIKIAMIGLSPHPVHPFLQPFVKAIVAMDFKQSDMMNTVYIAKTDSVLMFNIGNSASNASMNFYLPNQPEHSFTFYNHEAWIGGLLNQPLASQTHPSAHIICIVLTSYGIHNLLKESTTSVLNRGLSLETAGLQKHFDCLIDKLKYEDDTVKAFKLVEYHLIYFFSHLNIPFSIKDMSPVVNYIIARNGVIKVKDLEDKFRVSRRWIEKQFVTQVGLSPKEFSRILRFTATLKHALIAAPSVSWTSLLEDYGYYDQSHLIKDFHDFTGQTPVQYLKNTPLGMNNVFLKSFE